MRRSVDCASTPPFQVWAFPSRMCSRLRKSTGVPGDGTARGQHAAAQWGLGASTREGSLQRLVSLAAFSSNSCPPIGGTLSIGALWPTCGGVRRKAITNDVEEPRVNMPIWEPAAFDNDLVNTAHVYVGEGDDGSLHQMPLLYFVEPEGNARVSWGSRRVTLINEFALSYRDPSPSGLMHGA